MISGTVQHRSEGQTNEALATWVNFYFKIEALNTNLFHHSRLRTTFDGSGPSYKRYRC